MLQSLFSAWPALSRRLPALSLGRFPTPVERLTALEGRLGLSDLYIKRDDLSSPTYGGNKVRTLEVLFGQALALNAREIVATGALGSNHAVATALHAPGVGLSAAAILFPQPPSRAALENLQVTLGHANRVQVLPHWSFLPFAIWRAQRRGRVVMAPGGATPAGALGYVAAALELAEQVQRGELGAPTRIYVGVGSCCTTAGLLVGFAHAARLGIGFRTPPCLVAVRVTPWPVTSQLRILRLAARTADLLAALAENPSLRLSTDTLRSGLRLDGDQLGPGYGQPSVSGGAARRLFSQLGLVPLDTTYSSKSAAGFLHAAGQHAGPSLFWSTKSSAVLPALDLDALERAPAAVQRWMQRAEQEGAMTEPVSAA